MTTTYYWDITASRILNSSLTDQSGSDDNPVTNWTIGDDFVLVVQIGTSKGPISRQVRLEWRNVTDSGSWTSVAPSSGDIRCDFNQSLYTDGMLVTTGAFQCSGTPETTAQSGEFNELDNTLPDSGTYILGDEYYSELWFALGTDAATAGKEYEFRLYDITESTALAACVATLTMAASADVTITVPFKQHTLTEYAPTVTAPDPQTVTVPFLQNTLTTYAPTVTVTDHQTVTVPIYQFGIAQYEPTVTVTEHVEIIVPQRAFAFGNYAPTVTVTDHQTITVPFLQNALTTYAPTVGIAVTVTVPVANFSLATYAPTVTTTENVEITVPLQSLTFAGYAPTVTTTDHQTITVPFQQFTLTEYAPTVDAGADKTVVVPISNFSLSGNAPDVTVTDHQTIEVPFLSKTLTGYAPDVLVTVLVEVPLQSLTFAGYAPTVTATEHINVTVPISSMTLAGYAPTVDYGAPAVIPSNDGPPGIARQLLELEPISRGPSLQFQIRQEQDERIAQERAAAEHLAELKRQANARGEAFEQLATFEAKQTIARQRRGVELNVFAEDARQREAARQAEINKVRMANLKKARAAKKRKGK